MGGRDGLRGYMAQGLICVLDALNGRVEWQAVTPEPEDVSEKFDLLWQMSASRRKATQVKSSTLQIAMPSVELWCQELRKGAPADEYELVLVGPVSGGVAQCRELNGVRVPVPKSWDPDGMLAQAAHGIDLLQERKGLPSSRATVRLDIAQKLVTGVMWDTVKATTLTRDDLESRIMSWMSDLERRAEYRTMRIGLEAPYDPAIIEAISRETRRISGDYSFTVEVATKGSVRLVLEGTREGVDRLAVARAKNELNTMLGFQVTEFALDPERVTEEHPPHPRILVSGHRPTKVHAASHTRAEAIRGIPTPRVLEALALERMGVPWMQSQVLLERERTSFKEWVLSSTGALVLLAGSCMVVSLVLGPTDRPQHIFDYDMVVGGLGLFCIFEVLSARLWLQSLAEHLVYLGVDGLAAKARLERGRGAMSVMLVLACLAFASAITIKVAVPSPTWWHVLGMCGPSAIVLASTEILRYRLWRSALATLAGISTVSP